MNVIRYIIKAGIIFGLITSLVPTALMSVASLFNPGVSGFEVAFIVRETSLVVLYFISGWHAAKISGKRYVGILVALIAAGLGSITPTAVVYLIGLLITKSISFGWLFLSQGGTDVVVSCVLGVAFGAIGAVTGIRRANISRDI